MKKVLLGTFADGKSFPRKEIRSVYEAFGCAKIFVFNLNEDGAVKKYLVTFNIDEDEKNEKLSFFKEKFSNTILLQRNKYYNVLYTINSLNELVRRQSGTKNSNFKVDWSDYKNCLVLLDNKSKIKTLFIELADIVETKELSEGEIK
jgi:hypothetical protein